MTLAHWLLFAFAVWWIVWAIRPADWKVFAAEHSFTLATVAVLTATHSRWPLSDASYVQVFILLCMHTVGAHYTYSKVPYDRWSHRLTGWRPTQRLALTRNHYDRLVHFSFGLLTACPVREVLDRYAGLEGPWSSILAAAVVMAGAMVFELMEWGLSAWLGGSAGQDYVAAQGDEWDAHKDMGLASIGAVLALTAAAAVR
jgi:putative membrane protein